MNEDLLIKHEDIIEELQKDKEKLELIKTKIEQYENPELLSSANVTRLGLVTFF